MGKCFHLSKGETDAKMPGTGTPWGLFWADRYLLSSNNNNCRTVNNVNSIQNQLPEFQTWIIKKVYIFLHIQKYTENPAHSTTTLEKGMEVSFKTTQ